MSSGTNRAVCMLGLALGLLPAMAAIAQEGAQPTPAPTVTAPVVTSAPVVTAAPIVETSEAAAPAATPDEEGWINVLAADEAAPLGDKAAVDAASIAPPEKGEMTNEEILGLLRGNVQRPLTVADLAAVNDMLKRLEYQVQVEKKMSEMKLGIVPSARESDIGSAGGLPGLASMGGAVPGMNNGARGMQDNSRTVSQRFAVVRVFGSKGNYVATVVGASSDGISRQFQIKTGDQLDGARVVSVSVAGVRISDSGGISDLAFVSPMAVNGVSISTNAGR